MDKNFNNIQTTPIGTQIENLKVPMEARVKMCALNQMAKAIGPNNGYLMPSLFVACSGSEADYIAELYSHIFHEYKLYKQTGEKNYLKLTFPVEGNDALYGRFFSSPDIVACTTNQFSGVFLVDLSEWKSGHQISFDNNFMRLLDYIDKNKRNITFVFSVDKDFKGMDELINALKKKLNLEIFVDMVMGQHECVEYIVSQLNGYGVQVDDAAKQLIHENLNDGVYQGSKINHEVLDLIVQRILLQSKIQTDCKCAINPRLEWELMKEICHKVFDDEEELKSKRTIGFAK
ncbi:MAG: hypothetical protein IJO70_00860 [Lachnospiraceae bacterium]|nr:hypothetical protein [Lachnospiraceae bacterium]